MWGSPTIVGENVYFGIGNGDFAQSDSKPAGAIACLDRNSGKLVWQFAAGDAVLARPVIDGDSLYFGSRDAHGYCVDRLTGKLRWKRSLGSPLVAAPAFTGKRLIFAATAGRIEALDTATGNLIVKFDVAEDSKLRSQIFSSPAIVTERKLERRCFLYAGVTLDNLQVVTPTLYCLQE